MSLFEDANTEREGERERVNGVVNFVKMEQVYEKP